MPGLDPLTTGRVVGRVLALVGDTADPSPYPDAVGSLGTVTFSPPATVLRVPTALPVPATLVLRPVVCSINADGYLVDPQGAMGVYLVATNDPALVPFTYTVVYEFGNGSPAAHALAVPSGMTTDLRTGATWPVAEDPHYGVGAPY